MVEIDKAKLTEVIGRLDSDKPPTKKWACEYLGIRYNTTRLAKLIDEHIDDVARRARLRRKKRGTSATEAEVKHILEAYILGESVATISEDNFRPTEFIKHVLRDCGLPRRQAGYAYTNPEMVPEESLKQAYAKGDLVYSTRYDQPAEVNYMTKSDKVHGLVYSIWLCKEKMFAMQPWYELADLQQLKEKYNLTIRSDTWND